MREESVMRHRLFLLALTAGLVIVSPARAQFIPPLSVTGQLTYSVPAAGDLRARLLEHANAVAAADPMEAATALNCRGLSFARDGESDSAVTCYERAWAL